MDGGLICLLYIIMFVLERDYQLKKVMMLIIRK